MRRYWLLLAFLALAGCSSTGSKNPAGKPASRNSDNDRKGAADAPFWADPDDRDRPISPAARNNGRIPPAGLPERDDREGLLAGIVVDADGQRVPNAFVQVSSLGSTKSAKPIGVNTDGAGFFSVPVRSGSGYELAVRVDDRGQTLAGSMVVRPPDTKIVLRATSRNVSSVTPNAPPPIGSTGPFNGDRKKDAEWRDLPPLGDSKPHNGPAIRSAHPENIANDPLHASLPAANIPPLVVPERQPEPAPTPPQQGTIGVPRKSNKMEFELSDLQGKSWRFGDHQGKLVLLDFWGTWCTPCVKAIPQVKQISQAYGTSGLEVVGVACERDGKWNDQANNVARFAQRNQINYALYLEPDGQYGSVQDKFQVKNFPTLILLDRTGNTLYRGHDFVALEKAIKLNIR